MLLRAAFRILLMLALVVNGSGIARADVAPDATRTALAAQDTAPPCRCPRVARRSLRRTSPTPLLRWAT